MNAWISRSIFLAALMVVCNASFAHSQFKGSDSVVKATATTEKVADGKQKVTITLNIDSTFHLYANPVGNEDFTSNQTVVSFAKGTTAKIEYPAGELKKDKIIGDYRIYKGKVTIKATVQRPATDKGPMEVSIKVQACDDSKCLMPATIKVKVTENDK